MKGMKEAFAQYFGHSRHFFFKYSGIGTEIADNITPVIPQGLGRGVPNSTSTFHQLCL